MRSDRTDRAISIIIMAIAVLAMLFFSSCRPLKNTTRQKESIETVFTDRTRTETQRDSEIMILPFPKTPNERPKDTIVTVTGKKGATVTTSYDKSGNVTGQVFVSPSERVTEERDIKEEMKYEFELRSKQLDIEYANVVGKWAAITFIPIGFFFAVAFVLRKVLK